VSSWAKRRTLSRDCSTLAKNAKNETVRLKYPPSLTEQKQLYLDGGALVVAVGNDAGGHGVPLAVDPDTPGFVCDVPEEVPAEFVEPEFGKLEFVEPEFVEPEFAEPEFVVVGSDPGFAVAGSEPGFEVAGFVEPAVAGALPESVPHGNPLGVVPGVFVVFGLTVEGDVLVPDVAGAGEFDPGALSGEVAFGDDPFARLCGVVSGVGVAVAAGGVAVWPGGVAVWAGGVAVPGEPWDIVQLAQQQSMDNNVIIFADINADINLASKTDSVVLPSGFFRSMLRDHVGQDALHRIQPEIPEIKGIGRMP
jgi:hypothetical protein